MHKLLPGLLIIIAVFFMYLLAPYFAGTSSPTGMSIKEEIPAFPEQGPEQAAQTADTFQTAAQAPPQQEESFGTSDFSTQADLTCNSCSNCTDCAAGANTCRLTADISSSDTCINISSDNVVIECQGHTIIYNADSTGSVENGISAIGRQNIIIKNCTILDNSTGGTYNAGINFTFVDNGMVANNTIITNSSRGCVGIIADKTNNSVFRSNKLNTTSASQNLNYGISVQEQCYYNQIDFNEIWTGLVGATANNYGVFFRNYDVYNNVTFNNITTNGTSYNFGVSATRANFTIITDNIIRTDGSSNNNYGMSVGTQSNHTTIMRNLIFTDGTGYSHGIEFSSGSHIFANNTVRTFASAASSYNAGITGSATGLTIENNTIIVNGTEGEWGFLVSKYCSIRNNHLIMDSGSSFTFAGLRFTGLSYTNFTNNTIEMASRGPAIYSQTGASNITFTNNNITATEQYGVCLKTAGSLKDCLFNNSRWNCDVWIDQYGSNNVKNNLSNMTFHTPNGEVTLTGNTAIAGGNVNVTRSVLNISSNKAFVNTSKYSFLNTTGIVVLEGVSYSDPDPKVDFEDDGTYISCPDSTCTELNYSGTTFKYNVTHFTSYSSQEAPIESCPVTINQTTTLTQDISSDDACITFGADNIVIDCGGYTVSYNTDGGDYEFGVIAEGRNNVTLKNCVIRDVNSSGSSGYAVNFTFANESTVANNALYTNSTTAGNGIYLKYGFGNNFSNHTIITRGSSNYNRGVLLDTSGNNSFTNTNISTNGGSINNWGLRLSVSSYNNFTGATIHTNGTSQNYGVSIAESGDANRFSYINISTQGNSQRNDGIILQTCSGNIFTNIILLTNGTQRNYGINLAVNADNNSFNNINITTNGSSGDNYGVSASTAENNNFTGVAITADGDSSNHGIYLFNEADNNRFSYVNLSNTGSNSYGVYIRDSNMSRFNVTLFNATSQWIYSDGSILSNFTNTTFATSFGSINVLGDAQIGSFQEITDLKMNITNNNAFLNSSNLTFFNKTGIVELSGISSLDQNATVDYEDDGTYDDCLTPTCTELALANNVFTYKVTHFTSYSSRSVPLTAGNCLTINDSTIVVLSQNLESNATCITIAGDDATLDCAGHNITYAQHQSGNAVYANGVQRIVVQNCTLIQGNSSISGGASAINFTFVNDSIITNSSMFTNSTNSFGIGIKNSYRNNITTCNITANHTNAIHFITSVENGLVRGNNLTTVNSTVFFFRASSYNVIDKNNWYTITGNGINTFPVSNNNNFTFNNITARSGGIDIFEGSNNTLRNNIITLVNTSGSNNHAVQLRRTTAPTVDNQVLYNTISASGEGRFTNGILLSVSAHQNTIAYNNITVDVTANTSAGISFLLATNNIVDNNTITISDQTEHEAIAFASSSAGNRLTGNTVSASSGDAINISSSNNNAFFNTVLRTTGRWYTAQGSSGINLTNTTFEDSTHGSIRISGLLQPNSTSINLTDLQVTSNNAFVNSTKMPILNVSGQVKLNSITFTDPGAAADFEDDGTFTTCPSTICTEVPPFTNNIFTFNVTHFTTYKAQETYSAPGGGSSGGSSGGGGGVKRPWPNTSTPSAPATEQPSQFFSAFTGEAKKVKQAQQEEQAQEPEAVLEEPKATGEVTAPKPRPKLINQNTASYTFYSLALLALAALCIYWYVLHKKHVHKQAPKKTKKR